MINYRSSTQRKKLYNKLNKQINEMARYYRNRGYEVAVPYYEKTSRPTKADIEQLQTIKTTFRDDSAFMELNGVYYSANEYFQVRKKIRQQEKQEKMIANEIVITNFKAMVSRYPKSAEQICLNWIKTVESKHGLEKTAEMIYKAFEDEVFLTPEEAYDQTLLYRYLTRMFSYMEIDEKEIDDIMEGFDDGFTSYD